MREVALYVAATAGALLLGAALGCFRTPPRRLTANARLRRRRARRCRRVRAVRACAPTGRLGRASAALLVGASAFIAVDLLLQRYAGAGAVGLSLVAAVTLDGVPENLALGVGLAESGSYALLASIVVSNLPEAFGGAANMRQGGLSSGRVLLVWGLTAVLLAVALVAGRLAAGVASEQWLGMLSAFAAGAVLASLADSVMPEAYAEGGPLVAFATSGGFLVAYALTTLD